MEHAAVIATVVAVIGVVCLFIVQIRSKLPQTKSILNRAKFEVHRPLSRHPEIPPEDDLAELMKDPKQIDQYVRLTQPKEEKSKFWVQVSITSVVLLAALYVLVFKPEAETSLKDFCYTSIGTIIGFWLKP